MPAFRESFPAVTSLEKTEPLDVGFRARKPRPDGLAVTRMFRACYADSPGAGSAVHGGEI